jgi:hypothetical protein
MGLNQRGNVQLKLVASAVGLLLGCVAGHPATLTGTIASPGPWIERIGAHPDGENRAWVFFCFMENVYNPTIHIIITRDLTHKIIF